MTQNAHVMLLRTEPMWISALETGDRYAGAREHDGTGSGINSEKKNSPRCSSPEVAPETR